MDAATSAGAVDGGGDDAVRHPEFAAERRRLDATLAAIGRAVDKPLKVATGAGDETAVLAMEAHRAWRRVQLREALDSPYFARIDFVPEGAGNGQRPAETYYVGKTYFDRDGVTVTGWQAPVAALFYRATSTAAAYQAPAGEIRGTLQLKRRLVIDHSALVHVADDLDARPAIAREPRRQPAAASAPAGDALLRTALSGPASPWLRDIIATIQADQYALITAPADQVLVIQGVAGSGKTSIALHRLSYLVYPALVAGKIPPRCLVLGPNRLFLKYVSAVLPKLGLHHVVQTTVADWALQRMNLKGVRLADATFDALLAPDGPEGLDAPHRPGSAQGSPNRRTVPRAQKEALFRRSRLTTSRRMGALLERYVEWRRGRIAIPDDGWVVRQTIVHATGAQRLEHRLPADELRARHALHADRPFAVHRALFAENVLTLLTARYDADAAARAGIEGQLVLGQRRLQQAADLRREAQRLRAATAPAAGAPGPSPEPQAVRFGAAPVFGSTPVPRAGGGAAPGAIPPRSRPSVAATRPAGAAAEPFLRQQIRHIELAADRRQQEGEELVRRAEAALAATLSPESHDQARRGARARVAALVAANWPAIDPLRDYYALLADAPLLRHLADGLFDRDELALLTAPTPAARTIDLADLPAIHYLFVLSQDPEVVGRTGHEHVVVDEAQDVSELDLLCLRRLERRHRFTLLGDLAQSIYAHRGLTSWAQAEAIFAGAPYRYEECAVGYRTTAEITALANRVLASIARLQDAPSSRVRSARPALAQTVDRHGPPPSLTAAADEAELVAAVAGAVAGARERRYASIAIITKTTGRARHLAAGLKQAGVPDVALAAAPDFEYRGGVVLLPVHLAKGLEFDAAVVVDADANTYPATPFDGRLLYVALTRALHALHAIWTGQLSPHLLP